MTIIWLDRENFFKDAGEIADIRFAIDRDGIFKGFGHVEFATVEAALKVTLSSIKFLAALLPGPSERVACSIAATIVIEINEI